MELKRAAPPQAIKLIAEYINNQLEKNAVTLLVSGGSNIGLACAVRQKLNIKNILNIGLIDERFGPIGHQDSNWQKLMDAGFIMAGVKLMPVLKGLAAEETALLYAEELKEAASETVLIGIFGMGNDGHTAGILPSSSVIDSNELVEFYRGPDFERITLTPQAFKLFNRIFLVANGQSKVEQIKKLTNHNLPLAEQPAQSLKNNKTTLITDQEIGAEQ